MRAKHPDDPGIGDLGIGDLGIVYKKNLGRYLVHSRGRGIPCALSSRLRKEFSYSTTGGKPAVVVGVKEIRHVDPVAIGDEVRFVDAGDGTGMIVAVLPRRTKLTRPAPVPGSRVFEQVIVANAEQVVPVFSAAQPAPKWGLLDRYLVSAEAGGLAAVVCITKLDLARPGDGLDRAVAEYRRIGYPVVETSVVTGDGLAGVREALQGRVSVLAGKSGVGKTSLLNALQPGLGLRVQEVSRISKGRHTTSHPELFPLESGGGVVDTPGMREFGLWDIEPDELALHFPEMRDLVGACRFRLDCLHDEEPGCAVREAVVAGAISPGRYRSYRRMAEELR